MFLSDNIRDGELRELLFIDDLVITVESKEELQRRVLEWQDSLERQGLKVNSRIHLYEVFWALRQSQINIEASIEWGGRNAGGARP